MSQISANVFLQCILDTVLYMQNIIAQFAIA